MERVRGRQWEVESNSAIVEPKLVRHPGIDHIRVGKRAGQRVADKIPIESRQVVQTRAECKFVIEPAETHCLFGRYGVINSDLVVVIQGRLRLLTEGKACTQRLARSGGAVAGDSPVGHRKAKRIR